MTKRTALLIAYNGLDDILDSMIADYSIEYAKDDPYYKEIQEARAIIKKMMEDMQ